MKRTKHYPVSEPYDPLVRRKKVADDQRFKSDAEIRSLLTAHRSGDPGARGPIRDGLEWLIYNFVPPDRHQVGLKLIYDDELINIAYIALDVIVQRLQCNALCRLDLIEKHVRDEFARAFNEEKEMARHVVPVPPSTNSGKAEKFKSLRKRSAAKLPSSRGEDEPIDLPDSPTNGQIGASGISISTATETVLDDPEIATFGSRHNRAKAGAYTPATDQSGKAIDSPDIPAHKRDPAGGKRRLCGDKHKLNRAPAIGSPSSPNLLILLTRLQRSRFYGCQQPMPRRCECGADTPLVFNGKCAGCHYRTDAGWEVVSEDPSIRLTMHSYGTRMNELEADRRIDLAEPTHLTWRIVDLNRKLRELARAPLPLSPDHVRQMRQLYEQREDARERFRIEREINLRILELADPGLSVNVVAQMAQVRVREAVIEERAGEDPISVVTWRIVTIRTTEVARRIENMRGCAQRLRYEKPPSSHWDYTAGQLFSIRAEKLHNKRPDDKPCVEGCGRFAANEDNKCWPCHYLEECQSSGEGYRYHRERATLNSGVPSAALYYSAQPASGFKLPLLNDKGKPITPGSLGSPLSKEFQRKFAEFLRLDNAHDGGKKTPHPRKQARKRRAAIRR